MEGKSKHMDKGLEALKEIKICNYYEDEYIDDDYLGIGKQINIIEKELKALKIIKDTLGIRLSEALNTLGETYYYIEIGGVVSYLLKEKEEYDLLKEVLQEHE